MSVIFNAVFVQSNLGYGVAPKMQFKHFRGECIGLSSSFNFKNITEPKIQGNSRILKYHHDFYHKKMTYIACQNCLEKIKK